MDNEKMFEMIMIQMQSMNNEIHGIKNEMQSMNTKIDKMDEKISRMEDDIEEIKENTAITRGALNEVLDFVEVKFPHEL